MNLTHSVDSYVLRSVIRRAAFDVNKVSEAVKLISNAIQESRDTISPCDVELENMLNIYQYSGVLDVSIIDYINADNIGHVPLALLVKLTATLSKMLELGSSPVLTVHDAYFAHPNHCNAVRYWYKEILGELAESTILDFLVSQIVGQQVKWNKPMNNLPELIRNSNYSLC